MTAAVLLDRDGTIIEDPGYLDDPERVRLLERAAAGLRALGSAGYPLVVVSNQSGVGRGWITPGDAARVHDRFVEVLAAEGIELAGAYYCPHAPDDACRCRKPATGLLERAASDLDLDLGTSVMIGDKQSDVDAGRGAGCRTVLISDLDAGGSWTGGTARDLAEAAMIILEGRR